MHVGLLDTDCDCVSFQCTTHNQSAICLHIIQFIRRHKLKNKVAPVQVMKAYGGTPPLVLNFGTRVVNLTPHSVFTLGGKGTRYSLNGGMFGAQFFR